MMNFKLNLQLSRCRVILPMISCQILVRFYKKLWTLIWSGKSKFVFVTLLLWLHQASFLNLCLTVMSYLFLFLRASRLNMKGKYVVNEKRLLQLFPLKCPLCCSKVKVEKFTYGLLIILNQQCLQCEYRYQWKSQINASVPAAEDQHPTGGIDVTPEIQQVRCEYSAIP